MKSNFAFLDHAFPVLANFGKLAEQYLYRDSNSCLMKLGMIGETIVNLCFTYDRIPFPPNNTAINRINCLFQEGMLSRDLTDILHALRLNRNKAVHENYASVADGKTLLQMAYSLCEWFMQTYGDWSYQNQPFVMPEESTIAEPIRNPSDNPRREEPKEQAEQAREKQLIEEAERAATAAPVVEKEARKQQASKAASQRIRSEAETRYWIDIQLRQVGWEADTEQLRYSKGTRPAKGRNLAIAEWPTDSTIGDRGQVDYALFIGTQMVATVEAKARYTDIPAVIDYQCKDYSRNIRRADQAYQMGIWGDYKVPFTFATNGRPYLEQYDLKSGIWFLDLRQKANTARALRGWMSPAGLLNLLEQDTTARNRALQAIPYDLLQDANGLNLRTYQVRAIQAVEQAIKRGQSRVLLAMATGTGKTRTILGMMYRFLKAGRFRRILFLVDRTSLGEQAADVFREVKLEDLLTLDNIYNIQGLDDPSTEQETRIQIATVQSMIKRLLYNDGEHMPAVSDFDLLIVDEAHRGYILDREMGEDEVLYRDQTDYQSKYRYVVEYFDAVKVALTATPALQTTKIFGQPVFQYTYREAVTDGYLVDHDAPHKLATRLSTEGIHYQKGDSVTLYDPARAEIIHSELLADELDFDIESFNRRVITESFNRTVLTEIARDIDPEHPEQQGKTLIYAVNDAHADLIVKILKEIYTQKGVDNDAILKITGSVGGGNKKKVQAAINRFKNERFPSVVVTVDLLTTGIDVPAITTLVFMRRVKSRILFEQMLGRATRLCPAIRKTHFEIYDPVGVYDSLEAVNTMKPVVVNPTATFAQLLDGLEVLDDAGQVQNQITQLLAKLQRKRRRMDDQTKAHFASLADGKDPAQFIAAIQQEMQQAMQQGNPDAIKERLLTYRPLFRMLDQFNPGGSLPLVISEHADELLSHTRGYGKSGKPEDYLDAFAAYIQANRNEIATLNIICTRPKELTRESLKSLLLTLDREGFTTRQLNSALAQTTNQTLTADIISLIRRYALGSALVSHETRIKQAVDKLKAAHPFSPQELSWIARIEKYLMEESVLNRATFDEDSRFKAQGGFSRINKVFRDQLDDIIRELNDYLYDDGGETA